MIDQEETEPKLAWDSTCGWKSGPGRSTYASMLILRKRKQWGIFLDAPSPPFPRVLILSSKFSEKKDRRLSFLPCCYQPGNTSRQCRKPRGQTGGSNLCVCTQLVSCPSPLHKCWSMIILLFDLSVCIPDLDFCKIKDGWSLSLKSQRAENSYLIFWPHFAVQDGMVW